jgi:hypothetical protein
VDLETRTRVTKGGLEAEEINKRMEGIGKR